MRQLAALPTAGAILHADLTVPAGPGGVVVVARDVPAGDRSGGDPGDVAAATVAALHRSSLATLVIDLLTPAEAGLDLCTHELRRDIGLLAFRLAGVVDQLAGRRPAGPPLTLPLELPFGLPVGLLAGGTGATAALLVATKRPVVVRAVVCAGPPDPGADPPPDPVPAGSHALLADATDPAALGVLAADFFTRRLTRPQRLAG